MRKLLLFTVAAAAIPAGAEAQRPARPEIVEPPPPNNEAAVLLRNQKVEAMGNRLTLLNGVFFSKYATSQQ